LSWTRIQGTGAQNAAGPTQTIAKAFASNTAVGNLIVVRVTLYNNSGSAETVSDNLGNTYTKDILEVFGTLQAGVWHAPITSAGATTVTADDGSGNNAYWAIAIDEYSYTGSLSVESTVTSDPSQLGSPTTTPTMQTALTVTGTNLVAAILGADGNSGTITAGSGGVLRFNANYSSGSAEMIAAEDYINVTSNTTPSWTVGTSQTTQYAAAASYKGTGAAAQDPIGIAGPLCCSVP
jgi:hypothetical protein